MADDPFYQSATACCPRQTIPDSCSCLEDCECMCVPGLRLQRMGRGVRGGQPWLTSC